MMHQLERHLRAPEAWVGSIFHVFQDDVYAGREIFHTFVTNARARKIRKIGMIGPLQQLGTVMFVLCTLYVPKDTSARATWV
jgi:hypothetical protein